MGEMHKDNTFIFTLVLMCSNKSTIDLRMDNILEMPVVHVSAVDFDG